jgi:hypothetical protein
MTLDQLKKIGQLDQLKKSGALTQEEYDTAKARVLTEQAPVEPTKPTAQQNPTTIRGLLISAVFVLGFLSLVAWLLAQCKEPAEKTSVKAVESHFNPDVIQSDYMLTIKNRDHLPYNQCELIINNRFKANVTSVKPNDVYIIPNGLMADDNGAIYNPQTTRIVELEFYCKDYDGHSDILSMERK